MIIGAQSWLSSSSCAVSLIFQQPVYKLLAPSGCRITARPRRRDDGAHLQKCPVRLSFTLPDSWKASRQVSTWQGMTPGQRRRGVGTGTAINLRHPLWTEAKPRQDIPIMILALSQWNALQQDKFHIGAAPIADRARRNSQYVFACRRVTIRFPSRLRGSGLDHQGQPLARLLREAISNSLP